METPDDRRHALQGWVYAAVRIDKLMQGIARETENQVDFDVFEGGETTMASLIYDADDHLDAHRGTK